MLNSKDFLFLYVRIFLGFIFFTSGFCKLTDGHFAQLIGPPHLINDLAKFQLKDFGYLIASSQIICGTLLLSQRFSLLGLVALVPMNTAILGVTISQSWAGTPFVNAFLFILNIACLIYDYDIFKLLFSSKTQSLKSLAAVKFPDIKIPLAMLALAIVAALISPRSDLMLRTLTTAVFVLSSVNILRQINFSPFQKTTVFISTIFFVMFINILQLKHLSDLFEIIVIIVAFLSFLSFLLSFITKKSNYKANELK